jgi:hypothetical protein
MSEVKTETKTPVSPSQTWDGKMPPQAQQPNPPTGYRRRPPQLGQKPVVPTGGNQQMQQ